MTTAEAVRPDGQQGHGRHASIWPLEQILDSPEVKHVFADIKLGVAVPTPPVLIVQAVHDQLISVEDIDDLADTYKSGGASVTYHRDMFSEHLLLHPMSAPMALRWLTDRFAGKPLVGAHGSDEVADAAEPDDLRRHGADWRRSSPRWSLGGR